MSLVEAESACVLVPHGWVREVEDDSSVYYISPDNTVLRSRQDLVCYLTTDGTCKCGLRCPFQVDEKFSFDPDIIGLPDDNKDVSVSSCKVPYQACRNTCKQRVLFPNSHENSPLKTSKHSRGFVRCSHSHGDSKNRSDSFKSSNAASLLREVDILSGRKAHEVNSEPEDTLPFSAKMSSISHLKLVHLLRNVNRCFQLLQPPQTAASSDSNPSNLHGTLGGVHLSGKKPQFLSLASALIGRATSATPAAACNSENVSAAIPGQGLSLPSVSDSSVAGAAALEKEAQCSSSQTEDIPKVDLVFSKEMKAADVSREACSTAPGNGEQNSPNQGAGASPADHGTTNFLSDDSTIAPALTDMELPSTSDVGTSLPNVPTSTEGPLCQTGGSPSYRSPSPVQCLSFSLPPSLTMPTSEMATPTSGLVKSTEVLDLPLAMPISSLMAGEPVLTLHPAGPASPPSPSNLSSYPLIMHTSNQNLPSSILTPPNSALIPLSPLNPLSCSPFIPLSVITPSQPDSDPSVVTLKSLQLCSGPSVITPESPVQPDSCYSVITPESPTQPASCSSMITPESPTQPASCSSVVTPESPTQPASCSSVITPESPTQPASCSSVITPESPTQPASCPSVIIPESPIELTSDPTVITPESLNQLTCDPSVITPESLIQPSPDLTVITPESPGQPSFDPSVVTPESPVQPASGPSAIIPESLIQPISDRSVITPESPIQPAFDPLLVTRESPIQPASEHTYLSGVRLPSLPTEPSTISLCSPQQPSTGLSLNSPIGVAFIPTSLHGPSISPTAASRYGTKDMLAAVAPISAATDSSVSKVFLGHLIKSCECDIQSGDLSTKTCDFVKSNDLTSFHPIIKSDDAASKLHYPVTRSWDPPKVRPLASALPRESSTERTVPLTGSVKVKDFTIRMLNPKILPSRSTAFHSMISGTKKASSVSPTAITEKASSVSLSQAKEILLKPFHIPIVDCSSAANKPSTDVFPPRCRRPKKPFPQRKMWGRRPRRHTLGPPTLKSFKQEVERDIISSKYTVVIDELSSPNLLAAPPPTDVHVDKNELADSTGATGFSTDAASSTLLTNSTSSVATTNSAVSSGISDGSTVSTSLIDSAVVACVTEHEVGHVKENGGSNATENKACYGTEYVSSHVTEHEDSHVTSRVTQYEDHHAMEYEPSNAMDREASHVTVHAASHVMEFEGSHLTENGLGHIIEHETSHVEEREASHGMEHEANCVMENEVSHVTEHEAGHVTEHEAGHVTEREAGHVTEREAGHVTEHEAGHVTEHEAGHVTEHEAGHVTEHEAGHVTEHEAGHVTEHEAGHVTEHEAGHVTEHEAGHVTEHEAGHVTEHEAGHVTEHEAGHVTEHEDGHVTEHEAGHVTEHEAGHVTEHEAGHVTEHEAGHVTEHEAGHVTEHEDGHVTEHEAGHVTEHEDGHVTEHEASHVTEHEASHVTEHEVSHVTEHEANNVTEHEASHVTEHEASHVTEHEAGHVTEHEAGHVTEHEAGHVTEHEAGHVTEHEAGHVTEHEASHVTEHEVSRVAEHEASRVTEHEASHMTEHEASHVTEHEASHVTEHEASHVTEHEASHVTEHEASHVTEHEASHVSEHESSHALEHKALHLAEHQTSHMEHDAGYVTEHENSLAIKIEESHVTEHKDSPVVENEASHVLKHEASHVTGYEDSHVTKNEASHVTGYEDSHVTKNEDSHVTKNEASHVTGYEDSHVTKNEASHMMDHEDGCMAEQEDALENDSRTPEHKHSHVTECEASHVSKCEPSHVIHHEDSHVTEQEDSHVTENEDSHVSEHVDTREVDHVMEDGANGLSPEAVVTRTSPAVVIDSSEGESGTKSVPAQNWESNESQDGDQNKWKSETTEDESSLGIESPSKQESLVEKGVVEAENMTNLSRESPFVDGAVESSRDPTSQVEDMEVEEVEHGSDYSPTSSPDIMAGPGDGIGDVDGKERLDCQEEGTGRKEGNELLSVRRIHNNHQESFSTVGCGGAGAGEHVEQPVGEEEGEWKEVSAKPEDDRNDSIRGSVCRTGIDEGVAVATSYSHGPVCSPAPANLPDAGRHEPKIGSENLVEAQADAVTEDTGTSAHVLVSRVHSLDTYREVFFPWERFSFRRVSSGDASAQLIGGCDLLSSAQGDLFYSMLELSLLFPRSGTETQCKNEEVMDQSDVLAEKVTGDGNRSVTEERSKDVCEDGEKGPSKDTGKYNAKIGDKRLFEGVVESVKGKRTNLSVHKNEGNEKKLKSFPVEKKSKNLPVKKKLKGFPVKCNKKKLKSFLVEKKLKSFHVEKKLKGFPVKCNKKKLLKSFLVEKKLKSFHVEKKLSVDCNKKRLKSFHIECNGKRPKSLRVERNRRPSSTTNPTGIKSLISTSRGRKRSATERRDKSEEVFERAPVTKKRKSVEKSKKIEAKKRSLAASHKKQKESSKVEMHIPMKIYPIRSHMSSPFYLHDFTSEALGSFPEGTEEEEVMGGEKKKMQKPKGTPVKKEDEKLGSAQKGKMQKKPKGMPVRKRERKEEEIVRDKKGKMPKVTAIKKVAEEKAEEIVSVKKGGKQERPKGRPAKKREEVKEEVLSDKKGKLQKQLVRTPERKDNEEPKRTPSSDSRKKGFEEIQLALRKFCEEDDKSSEDTNLVISIPLRLGRTTIAHHTLLSCSGGACPVEEEVVKTPMEFVVGDIVWAKAPYLPAWPGKVIAHKGKKVEKASSDKVWVKWFGESTMSLVPKTNIKPIKDGLQKRLNYCRIIPTDLKEAILEAMQAARNILK